MKRNPLYGGSSSSRPVPRTGPVAPSSADAQPAEPRAKPRRALRQNLLAQGQRLARRWRSLSAGAVGAALTGFLLWNALHPPHAYTQDDINAAVAYALAHKQPEPSTESVAAETIRPSVVRVVGYALEEPDPKAKPKKGDDGAVPEQGANPMAEEIAHGAISVGSGVVIDEKGTILTNWHVADSAPRLRVTFSNGLEADADIVGAKPEQDLAVIRAHQIPDDLKPATLVSTGGLRPGDEVVAVGFPFAIGPSVSHGIVSGLKREWPRGDGTSMTNLIQFDAAANPGNSGGPLVNRNGEVLGIVTGILNPTKQHVFIGIGYAVPIENAMGAVGMSPF